MSFKLRTNTKSAFSLGSLTDAHSLNGMPLSDTLGNSSSGDVLTWNGFEWISSYSGGGGGGIDSYGYFNNATGPDDITSATAEEILWDSGPSPQKGSDITINSKKIVIQKSGVYKVDINVAYTSETGNGSILHTFLSQSTTLPPFPLEKSSVYTYHNNNTDGGYGSGNINWVGNLAVGELRVWTIQVMPATDSPTLLFRPNCYLDVEGTRAFISKLI